MNNRQIKREFDKLPVAPKFDRKKMHQTIMLAKAEYILSQNQKRVSFFEFLVFQLRFITYQVWLSQIIILVIFLLFISQADIIKIDLGKNVFVFLSALSPMIALCGFTELLKSTSYSMEEIEGATRYSLSRLIAARFIIIGVLDLFCLTLIVLTTTITTGMVVTSFILYLLVPFLLTCCMCLTVMNRVRSQNDKYICAAVSVGCTTLFYILSFWEKIYTAASITTWVIAFSVTLLYALKELLYMAKQLKGETILCHKI